MKPRLLILLAAATFLPACSHSATPSTQLHSASTWVYPSPSGKLHYQQTPAGDQIMDFSYAGYHGGGVSLPTVPVVKTLSPLGNDQDDTANIQSALDQLGKLPLNSNGFRGALLLNPGTYICSAALTITNSGVVLRGTDSSGPNVSTLKLVGKPHGGIIVRQAGAGRGRRNAPDAENPDVTTLPSADSAAKGPPTQLADAYVPSGATTFTVKDASSFHPGDWIALHRPVTTAWIHFMQMDDLARDGKHQTWIKAGSITTAERQITNVTNNQITIDVPLSDSYDAKYLNPPGVDVAKINPPALLSEIGIEHLHMECPPQEINHDQAHYQALRINGQDLWVRDLIADETMDSIGIGGRRITLEHVAVNRKAPHLGASKPAEFAPNGTQVLLDRCSVSGDNVWFSATGAGVSGPIVLLNCVFRGNGRAESHQRWSTGMLYDNCIAPEGGIEVRNRGSMGSGHGWGMGWAVLWNCDAKSYIVQNPPGATNWLIGSAGQNELSPRPFGSGPLLPAGTIDSPQIHVAPQSLYLEQLKERLGDQALRNIGYSSPSDIHHEDAWVPPPPKSAATDKNLGSNQAFHRPVSTSNTRQNNRNFGGEMALDGDPQTYWATDDNTTKATLELDTEGAITINALKLAEPASLANRVQEYKVEGQIDSGWQLLAQGTTIDPNHLARFPTVTVWKIRLTISKARAAPAISEFALYLDKDIKNAAK